MRVVRKILSIILMPLFFIAGMIIVVHIYLDEKDFVKGSGVIEEIEE